MQSKPEKGNAPEISPSEASIEVSQTSKKGISMSNFTPALTIGGATVRRAGDLFSLNDLHKAAGGEAKHKPSEWLRNQQAQDLLEEIQKAGIPAITSKPKVGTYACRELVIAYAAWISATFHLKVIRVFLDATAPAPTQRPYNPALDYERISPSQAQDIKELVHQVVDSGVQTFGETWNRLHNKFRVNSYLELPATKYDEVCAYLRGKLPPAPAPAPAPKPAPAPQPSFITKSVFISPTAMAKCIELRDDGSKQGVSFASNLLGEIQFALMFNGSAAHTRLTVSSAREMGNALLEVAAAQAALERRAASAS